MADCKTAATAGMKRQKPIDEAARLDALHRYWILDTDPEESFDALTRLAAGICNTPVSLITFIDADRQWVKSKLGLGLTEAPRETAFCARTIEADDILVVPDTRADSRFSENSLVTAEPFIRFYAGAPLATNDGHGLGALCVIDYVPRTLRRDQIEALSALAREVMIQIELRRKTQQLEMTQRRAVEALQQSESQLRLITDALPALIAYVDAEQKYRFNNKAYEDWFGRGRNEINGKHLTEVLGDSAYQAVGKHLEQVLSGQSVSYEARMLYKYGAARYTSTNLVPDVSEAGEVKGFVALINDITARKQAEEALTRSEQRYRSLVTATASIVWTAAPDGAIVDDVPSWETFTGQTSEGYKGFGWLNAVHPDDRARTAEIWRRAFEDRTPVEIEERLRHRDGRYRHMLVHCVPVFDADGRLREWIGHCNDISEHKQVQERLRYLANYDALTKLPNRLLLMDRLRQAVASALRHSQGLAVLSLDLDNFRQINDTLGHEVGDLLLKTVAERLTGCIRGCDTVARVGGDEFALVLIDLSRGAYVNRVARKILATLSEPVELAGNQFFITASIGVSLCPRDGDDPQHLLKCAGDAMNLAGKYGNRYRHYPSKPGTNVARRLTLEQALRRALAREEFVLYYQPQIDLANGRIDAVEALVRWRRPGSIKLVAPQKFIPMAEDNGLILAIGEWVLGTACAQIEEWRARKVAPPRIALNVSACQLHRNNIETLIDRTLRETGLDPSDLELELTESILQTHKAERVLSALRRIGIKIAIDGFGIGLSSLSYLKQFSIDKLKINRAFTRGIPGHAGNAAISTAVIAMAHSLHLKVTAEGVETDEQLQFLRALHCDAAQGYLLSRPLSASALTKLMVSRDS